MDGGRDASAGRGVSGRDLVRGGRKSTGRRELVLATSRRGRGG